MAYATVADLLNRIDSTTLGKLSDDVNATPDYTATAAAAVISAALEDASALIDSYVLGHLDMTDGANITAVKYHCCVLALYYLHNRQFADDDKNPKTAQKRSTMEWLKAVHKRDLHVQTGAPLHTIYTTTSNTDKKFTDTTMSGFID